jgi:hypothetical protein
MHTSYSAVASSLYSSGCLFLEQFGIWTRKIRLHYVVNGLLSGITASSDPFKSMLFIYLDLMIRNRKITIERYFKWWISTKLV